MIKLEMKKYNTILKEKQQKYQHYKYEFLTAEEIPSDQRRRIEQALKSLKSEENQELESIEGPFQKG